MPESQHTVLAWRNKRLGRNTCKILQKTLPTIDSVFIVCCCPQQAELLQQLQRELEALREQFRRQQDSTQVRGEGEGRKGGERGVTRKKGKFHWCSLTLFVVSSSFTSA